MTDQPRGPQFQPPSPPSFQAPQPPPRWQPPTLPSPQWGRPAKPPFNVGLFVVLLVSVLISVATLLFLSFRPGSTSEDTPLPSPTTTRPGPSTPVAPPSGEDLSTINPGYNPVPGAPFASGRATREPVRPPSATPTQTWPDEVPPAHELTGWRTFQADKERGTFQLPADWEFSSGTVFGYETMQGPSILAGSASFYRDDQCNGHDYARTGVYRAQDGTDAARITARLAARWAQASNTQYEGDYYDVPEPTVGAFTFADGTEGTVASVTFVPAFTSKYNCNAPATRITVVGRVSAGETHGMIAIAQVGLPDSLTAAHEREILSRFVPPA